MFLGRALLHSLMDYGGDFVTTLEPSRCMRDTVVVSKAAEIAGKIFGAMGLDVEVAKNEIIIKSCPIWNRILERGLEFSFHVEEICWMPLLEGIGERIGATPIFDSSLRLIHIEHTKIDHKKARAKIAFEKGDISKEDYDKQIVILEKSLESTAKYGHYRFE